MAQSTLQAPAPEQLTPDELLEEIFLRLPTAADLARAAMACGSFRRIIAGHRFLRRFRVLHPPPLLGMLEGIINLPFRPTLPPHPSAAAARAFADADPDLLCDFLPSRDCFLMTDIRDGRVLLAGGTERGCFLHGGFLRHFAVCDPLHRRYLMLPVIPDDLAALLDQREKEKGHFDYFLAPPAKDEDDLSFRVMCLARCTTKLVLFVFSRGAGQWRAVPYYGWISLMTGQDNPASVSAMYLYWASERYYWRGRFCWAVEPTGKLLMLHTDTMEFSAINLPPYPGAEELTLTFAETAEGKFGMFTIEDDGNFGDLSYHLWCATLRKARDGTTWWKSNARISLPLKHRYRILGIAGGYLLLQVIPKCPVPEGLEMDCLSLDLQTLQLELFCGTRVMIWDATMYAGFPPSLSAPTI